METILSSLLSLTVVFLLMALIYVKNHKKLVIQTRLEDYTRDTDKIFLIPELNQPLGIRLRTVISRVMRRISGRMVPGRKKEAWARRLVAAGNPCGLDADSFLLLKYLFIVISAVAGFFSGNIFCMLLFAGVAFILPDFYLKSQEKRRKSLILRSLPDVLDLLCVSVEAGLGFDAALQRVIEKYPGPLCEEFEKTLKEINVGKPRREALRDMAERVRVDEITTFMGSVIQAEQLGVSITNVLRLQSEQVREDRRMRAEEKAQQAAVKILIPLVLFIFPTILIVLLGPAVIQMMDTFGH